MPPHIFGMLQGESVKWHWSEDELETQWSLTAAELALLVYVNTLLQCVLSEKQWRGRMNVADLRALSPLIYSHVNPYGRFDLDMNKRLSIEVDLALAA